jgi:hypothetical protein
MKTAALARAKAKVKATSDHYIATPLGFFFGMMMMKSLGRQGVERGCGAGG